MDEGKKALLEIIENGLLGFCVGYYRGKFKLVILEKTIFYFYYLCWIFAILMSLGMPQLLDLKRVYRILCIQ